MTMESSLLDWLSSPGHPASRYLAARHLSPSPPPAEELDATREAVAGWEPMREILALQRDDGGFRHTGKTKTSAATFAAVGLMVRCGMDLRDEALARAVDQLLDAHLKRGAVSHTTAPSGVLPCYVGVMARTLMPILGHDHPAMRSCIDYIIEFQRFDHKDTRAGGTGEWPYKAVDNYGGCWWSVSCYHGVAATFGALAAIPAEHRSDEVKDRLAAALRYLEIHRVYKRSSIDRPLFRHLTQFFLVGDYRVHLIDVLEGIADADPGLIERDWIRAAVDDVDALCLDGKVTLIKNYAKQLMDPVPLEPIGEPSRLLTLQWLRAKRAFGLERT